MSPSCRSAWRASGGCGFGFALDELFEIFECVTYVTLDGPFDKELVRHLPEEAGGQLIVDFDSGKRPVPTGLLARRSPSPDEPWTLLLSLSV